MRKRASWFTIAAIGLGLAFLYLPIAILVIYSFNASRLVTVWGGWSTRWYISLLSNEAMLEAAWISLRIAFVTACTATVLGTYTRFTTVCPGVVTGIRPKPACRQAVVGVVWKPAGTQPQR